MKGRRRTSAAKVKDESGHAKRSVMNHEARSTNRLADEPEEAGEVALEYVGDGVSGMFNFESLAWAAFSRQRWCIVGFESIGLSTAKMESRWPDEPEETESMLLAVGGEQNGEDEEKRGGRSTVETEGEGNPRPRSSRPGSSVNRTHCGSEDGSGVTAARMIPTWAVKEMVADPRVIAAKATCRHMPAEGELSLWGRWWLQRVQWQGIRSGDVVTKWRVYEVVSSFVSLVLVVMLPIYRDESGKGGDKEEDNIEDENDRDSTLRSSSRSVSPTLGTWTSGILSHREKLSMAVVWGW
ncbi:hypothetical protein CPB84DRAFT_1745510 [Gymnopilus junonius]|uniref:Uncharacterized protein n=1 Tax=Gymnopilus junonius TaxID=109634 RepID=A0A9P5NR10_GYMJU|nr:hypothetical protein CPB84DRAFT_1745510 [Gymnopilus junonius]